VALFEPVFAALHGAGVRYVVVGGVAVVLHGHARLTADLDLVVDLSAAQAKRTIETLVGLGLEPRAPVDPLGFAEPSQRAAWIKEKNMEVFSMWSRKDPMLIVDLFVEEPIPFEDLWARSLVVPLGSISVRVAAIADLISMKLRAGRPQDLLDIEELRRIDLEKTR
jgi:hypothetical protein